MFIGICSRSQVSVYRTIGSLVFIIIIKPDFVIYQQLHGPTGSVRFHPQFSVLHLGHIAYINEGKNMFDFSFIQSKYGSGWHSGNWHCPNMTEILTGHLTTKKVIFLFKLLCQVFVCEMRFLRLTHYHKTDILIVVAKIFVLVLIYM